MVGSRATGYFVQLPWPFLLFIHVSLRAIGVLFILRILCYGLSSPFHQPPVSSSTHQLMFVLKIQKREQTHHMFFHSFIHLLSWGGVWFFGGDQEKVEGRTSETNHHHIHPANQPAIICIISSAAENRNNNNNNFSKSSLVKAERTNTPKVVVHHALDTPQIHQK